MTPEQDLRQHLEDMDRLRLQRGWVYSSPQRFVLTHGVTGAPHPVPPGMWQGRPRCCFDNAITVAMLYDIPYIEGYALLGLDGQTLALHHAWNLDAHGRVIDVTWHPYVGLAYLGVQFAPERADEATWNFDGTILEDDKRRYPLLREPWHGEPPGVVWPHSPRLDRIRRMKRRLLGQEVCHD